MNSTDPRPWHRRSAPIFGFMIATVVATTITGTATELIWDSNLASYVAGMITGLTLGIVYAAFMIARIRTPDNTDRND